MGEGEKKGHSRWGDGQQTGYVPAIRDKSKIENEVGGSQWSD